VSVRKAISPPFAIILAAFCKACLLRSRITDVKIPSLDYHRYHLREGVDADTLAGVERESSHLNSQVRKVDPVPALPTEQESSFRQIKTVLVQFEK
jgi:hypothetical protein